MIANRTKTPKSPKHYSFPPVLNIEVTNECNLECPMCARTTSMSRPVQHMTEEMYRKTVDQASEGGVETIWLHMFGESLLHPKIYDYIRYAADKPGIRRVALSTNVTTLTEKNSRRILDSGLHHLILSVDAHSEDVYEVVRGFNFERVMSNARKFLDLHRDSETEMSVEVSIINMGIKRGEIADFKADWAEYESDRVQVLVKQLINFGGLVNTEEFSGDDGVDTAVPHGNRRVPCRKLWKSLTIMSNAEVVACCYDVDGSMTYGNLKDKSLAEIWDGAAIASLREKHLKLDFKSLPLCNGCDATFAPAKSKPSTVNEGSSV